MIEDIFVCLVLGVILLCVGFALMVAMAFLAGFIKYMQSF